MGEGRRRASAEEGHEVTLHVVASAGGAVTVRACGRDVESVLGRMERPMRTRLEGHGDARHDVLVAAIAHAAEALLTYRGPEATHAARTLLWLVAASSPGIRATIVARADTHSRTVVSILVDRPPAIGVTIGDEPAADLPAGSPDRAYARPGTVESGPDLGVHMR